MAGMPRVKEMLFAEKYAKVMDEIEFENALACVNN